MSSKRGIIIGQAPPEKTYAIPFKGTRLYKWFSEIGVPETDVISFFDFDSLVNKFPGKNTKGHNIPNPIDIERHIPTITKKIDVDNLTLIVPVGKLSIQHTLNVDSIELTEVVGKVFFIKPFGQGKKSMKVIPLPHPSGLNTWGFQPSNRVLLNNALQLIKDSM